MKHLLITLFMCMSFCAFSQSYEEGKKLYEEGNLQEAFSILNQIDKSSPNYKEARRLANKIDLELREKVQNNLKTQREDIIKKSKNQDLTQTPAPKIVQTRYLTPEEITKKQKQLKSSGKRFTIGALLTGGLGIASVAITNRAINEGDADMAKNARTLGRVTTFIGVYTGIELIVFTNKSANLMSGVDPNGIKIQIKF